MNGFCAATDVPVVEPDVCVSPCTDDPVATSVEGP